MRHMPKGNRFEGMELKSYPEKQRELLRGESELERCARHCYIDRFSDVPTRWSLESNIAWGIAIERDCP